MNAEDDHLAQAETKIAAPPDRIWQVLTDPTELSALWLGASVQADWEPGGSITWEGEWEGKPYRDKGQVLVVEPESRLSFTHFSPLGGKPDTPENYHTLTFTLTPGRRSTHVRLTQDNNPTREAAEHSEELWQQLLGTLKEIAERE